MKLYGYFRSSAAYRVRIVLNLKGLEAEHEYVHLVRDGGEHRKAEFLQINPQGLLPALQTDDGGILLQSLAILDYLEETHPEPALLPADPFQKAQVRALCQMVACEIHPLNNLRVLQYLKDELAHDQDTVATWYRHWVTTGFEAIEKVIGDDGFCFGGRVSLADACLVPQIFNAHRFKTDLSAFPRIIKVEEVCGALAAFGDAHPANQPDSE
ncbi:MAG: maleylacetoacetate isomerase [Pseudomonadota bacterium]